MGRIKILQDDGCRHPTASSLLQAPRSHLNSYRTLALNMSLFNVSTAAFKRGIASSALRAQAPNRGMKACNRLRYLADSRLIFPFIGARRAL